MSSHWARVCNSSKQPLLAKLGASVVELLPSVRASRVWFPIFSLFFEIGAPSMLITHKTYYSLLQGASFQRVSGNRQMKVITFFFLFFSETLLDQSVVNFLGNSEQMIFWACNINSPEGYRVSQVLRVHSFPFIGVVALSANPGTTFFQNFPLMLIYWWQYCRLYSKESRFRS